MENLVYTVGTTAHFGNQEWAYVTWQAGESTLLRGGAFAVYAKPGEAGAATPYVRKAIVSEQVDPAVIAVLLQRAVSLGENLGELDSALSAAFQKLMPSGSLDLASKLSIVMRGSLGQPEHYDNLLVLSRMHPGVTLCLGLAHAETISVLGQTTFEVRQFDLTRNQDIAVVGRVTVTAGAPLVLPAPGRPAQLPEANSKGDLNIKLRWAVPPELRRLSMMQYGYNIYRMPKAVALANNYQNNPPSTAALLGLMANLVVKRVNEVAVLPAKSFTTDAEAGNFNPQTGDAETYFLSDDRRRDDLSGASFYNGEEFYYFVTARDILGRDGKVSLGGLARACDRLPPDAPGDVQVLNSYSYATPEHLPPRTNQFLKVTWRQHPNTNTNDVVTAYYVYRWNKASDALTLGNNPNVNLIAGPIPHINGQETASFVDNGQGPFAVQPATPPTVPQDAGRTFWYTVRAVDNGACSNNFSPHSAPAYGVLRDREGPPPPDEIDVNIRCSKPVVSYLFNVPVGWTEPDPDLVAFQVACTRSGAGAETIAWAEFSVLQYLPSAGPPMSNFLGRVNFPSPLTPNDFVNAAYFLPRSNATVGATLVFGTRAGTSGGRVSDFAFGPVSLEQFPNTNQFLAVAFDAHLVNVRSDDCGYHEPVQPGTNEILGIDISFVTTLTTREYKIFRRVGNGPLTLIKQGTTTTETPQQIQFKDKALPSTSAEVCYFVQFFDAHGNPGVLTLLKCIPCAGTTPLPKPMLLPIEPGGSESNAFMKIAWVCPPYGVERFRVHVAVQGSEPPQNSNNEFSVDLSPNILSNPVAIDESFKLDGASMSKPFKIYLTPQIGPGFGNEAQFIINAKVEPDRAYLVMVQALGKANTNQLGTLSEVQEVTWHVPKPPVPLVPWPARPLPEVSTFHPKILALQMSNNVFRGLGIRIGDVKCHRPNSEGPLCLPPAADPVNWVYKGNSNQVPLFPIVLYRYQVPSAAFPNVSGDVVQTSPMMESIAYTTENVGGVSFSLIRDPFFRQTPPQAASAPMFDLYLVDTQPVIIGASYRYLLVRFDAQTKEPIQVIPTNPVTVLPP